MTPQFILSLFPGLDILGRAFSAAGHTVVRGPDLVTGDRIEDFHGLVGHVDGIIAGPPCQDFSRLRRSKPSGNGERMLRELLRVAAECDPMWILVENVPGVPSLIYHGRRLQRLDLTDLECGGIQLRRRHWQWWHRLNRQLAPARQLNHSPRSVTPAPHASPRSVTPAPHASPRSVTPAPHASPRSVTPAVTASPGQSQPSNYAERCRRMGLSKPIKPAGWSHAALCRAIGNAVTWHMATVMAAAVTRAIGGHVESRRCICGCGRSAPQFGEQATAACRKRMERSRRSIRHTIEI